MHHVSMFPVFRAKYIRRSGRHICAERRFETSGLRPIELVGICQRGMRGSSPSHQIDILQGLSLGTVTRVSDFRWLEAGLGIEIMRILEHREKFKQKAPLLGTCDGMQFQFKAVTYTSVICIGQVAHFFSWGSMKSDVHTRTHQLV